MIGINSRSAIALGLDVKCIDHVAASLFDMNPWFEFPLLGNTITLVNKHRTPVLT